LKAIARMSRQELDLKTGLEARIASAVKDGKRAHFLIGECLDQIIEHRLYRDDYLSFEAYCEGEWGFSGAVGRRSANCYRVAKNLENADQASPEVYWSILSGLKPSHAEKLAMLPEPAQVEAWQEARQESTTPTVNALEQIVVRHKERLQKVATMTAEEESSFNRQIETETLEAYQKDAKKSEAKMAVKRVQSLIRKIPEFLQGDFKHPIDKLNQAIDEFKKLGT
jgi:hypothetical protein